MVIYPEKKEISHVKRIGLSLILSIISVMLLVLFIDEGLAFNTTPGNIIVAILIFSFLAVCIWKGELLYSEHIPKLFVKKRGTGKKFFPVTFPKLKNRSGSGNTDVETKSKTGENDDGL